MGSCVSVTKKSNTSIAIIGGGLIGLFLSIVLSRKGIKVDVYEKREEIIPVPGRLTSIYLAYRGIVALKKMGIDAFNMKGHTILTGFSLRNA
jgi:2-polyprenyl-6-methoxyphenol hydroxylase-like FAD-dependent oxidoreductase